MGLVPEQEHLTVLDPAFERQRAVTVPGMAYFAGTGPRGKTCRMCEHWTGCGEERGYYTINGKHGGVLKPRACAKYRAMMGGEVGRAIPFEASACKYFVESKNPPPVVEKRE